jgi:hypothetical protein
MKKIIGVIAALFLSCVAHAQTFPVQNLNVLGNTTMAKPPAIAGNCQNILTYGGSGNGVTANDTALTALLAAEPAGQKCAYFPPGKFVFASPVSYTMVNTIESVSIVGAGADKTELTWPSGNGITLNYIGPYNSAHVRDMTLSTGAIGGGTALNLNQTAASIPNPANTALSDVTGVTVRGADGYVATDYWGNGIAVNGVSNVNFISDVFDGPATPAGNGLLVQGTAALPPVQFNVTACVFNWNSTGIQYGNYVQGINVSQSNFVGGSYGIASQSSLSNLDQLTVSGSQLNQLVADILENTSIPNTMIVSNEFIVQTNAIGISLPQGGIYSIIGNTIGKNPGATNTNGIVIANSTGPGIVSGNVFVGLTTGVNLQSTSSAVNVQSNSYAANGSNVVNSSGLNNVGGGSQ